MRIHRAILPLLAGTMVASCGGADDQSATRTNQDGAASATADSPDKCVDGNAMNVGDRGVELKLSGTDYRWDTSGDFVTLTKIGNGKAVDLVQSTSPAGPSLLPGDCLRSGGYIRLARAGDAGPNRYLQALLYGGVDQPPHPDPHVTIGNYPDPNHIDSIFNVVKVAGSDGKIIRKGDTIIIRGVSRDPWLKAPTNPAEGSQIELIDWDKDADASRWVINKGK